MRQAIAIIACRIKCLKNQNQKQNNDNEGSKREINPVIISHCFLDLFYFFFCRFPFRFGHFFRTHCLQFFQTSQKLLLFSRSNGRRQSWLK